MNKSTYLIKTINLSVDQFASVKQFFQYFRLLEEAAKAVDEKSFQRPK